MLSQQLACNSGRPGELTMNVIFDMETQDPDDSQTLCRLLDHPMVNLRAVTVLPGSAHQIGVVRGILSRFHKHIPVGARDIDHPEPAVSRWHYRAYGDLPPSRDAEPAAELLVRLCDEETTLITGGPLSNVADAIRLAGERFKVARLVAMGGFAGEGTVPDEYQLEEFRGQRASREFNFCVDPEAVLLTLSHPGIAEKRLVSKNCTHAAIYDHDLHERLTSIKGQCQSIDLIHFGMDGYLDGYIRQRTKQLKKRSQRFAPVNGPIQCKTNCPAAPVVTGKKIHDLLAACCAIDPSIAEWAEVEVYREENRWGARSSTGSRVWITKSFQQERFENVLMNTGGI